MKEKFILTNGYIKVDNKNLYIKKKEKHKQNVFLVLLIIAFLFKKLKDINISKQIDYIEIGIFVIVSLILISLLIYFIFFYHWKNKIDISSISKIEVNNEDDLETEIYIITNKNRQKNIIFRSLENQLKPFLESLKKRNSRIEIVNNK